jgi:hypothetical protein
MTLPAMVVDSFSSFQGHSEASVTATRMTLPVTRTISTYRDVSAIYRNDSASYINISAIYGDTYICQLAEQFCQLQIKLY